MVECGVIARRVLSIDGGGLKGAMPAAFLAEVESATGKRVADHFDLIAGTSTGGIIALGIGLGLPCSEILAFYQEKGPAVFGESGGRLRTAAVRSWRLAKRLVRHKHPAEPLREALADVFGQRLMGESLTRLVIPAWDSTQRRPYLFKTAHRPRFEMDHRVPVVEVAMATAAAPTCLPAHRLRGGLELVDGGIWANNPATIAALEATAVLGWVPETVTMLSLGSTDERLVVPRKMGLVSGARLGVEMMFQGQSFASDAAARIVLGGGGGCKGPRAEGGRSRGPGLREARQRRAPRTARRTRTRPSAAGATQTTPGIFRSAETGVRAAPRGGGRRPMRHVNLFDRFLRDVVDLNATRITTLEDRVQAVQRFLNSDGRDRERRRP